MQETVKINGREYRVETTRYTGEYPSQYPFGVRIHLIGKRGAVYMLHSNVHNPEHMFVMGQSLSHALENVWVKFDSVNETLRQVA